MRPSPKPRAVLRYPTQSPTSSDVTIGEEALCQALWAIAGVLSLIELRIPSLGPSPASFCKVTLLTFATSFLGLALSKLSGARSSRLVQYPLPLCSPSSYPPYLPTFHCAVSCYEVEYCSAIGVLTPRVPTPFLPTIPPPVGSTVPAQGK